LPKRIINLDDSDESPKSVKRPSPDDFKYAHGQVPSSSSMLSSSNEKRHHPAVSSSLKIQRIECMPKSSMARSDLTSTKISSHTSILPKLSLEFFQALGPDELKQWMKYFGMKNGLSESFTRNRLAENCRYLQTGQLPETQRNPGKKRNEEEEMEIINAIRQTSFFEEILTFTPIDLNELQVHLRETGVRIDLKGLRSLLEEKGVTIKFSGQRH